MPDGGFPGTVAALVLRLLGSFGCRGGLPLSLRGARGGRSSDGRLFPMIVTGGL